MESTALFEEKVPLTPRDFSKDAVDINNILRKKLGAKLDGRCSLHGWVKPNSIQVIGRSVGYVEKGRFTGDIVFHVQAEGRVINPPSGILITGEVIRKNKMGMYVTYEDAIRIILPRDLHIGNEEYDSVEIGERVRVEIKKSRFQVNDENILSVGLFRGLATEDYTAPAPAPVAEEVIEETEEQAEPAAPEVSPVEEVPPTPVEAAPVAPPPTNTASATIAAPAPAPEENMTPIEFYTKLPEYKELTTAYPAAMTIDGKSYPTVEHYMQAMKFPSNPTYQERIRTAKTAAVAKSLGSTTEVPTRPDWDTARDEAMKKALEAKFTQNPQLKQLLLDTGNRPLADASPSESYWGLGRNKKGTNRLGTLLMELRSALRQASA